MTQIVEEYRRFVNGGHPVFRQTFLLRSLTPMLTIVSAYVLFVTYVGPAIMSSRKPLNLRRLIVVYNLSLVGYYLYFLIKGVYFMHKLGFATFCGHNLDARDPFIVEVYYHVYIVYAVRFVELLDTVFLVLLKKFKMVTPFHVFHHASVPVIWWFGYRSEIGTHYSVFIATNSFVHTIMYSYYALAALRPQYQKNIWWKKYLTLLQTWQFFIISIYVVIMYSIGCASSKFITVFSFLIFMLFFFLFIMFYRRTYLKEEMNKEHQNGSDQRLETLPFDKTQ